MNATCGLKVGPRPEVRFLKLGGVFSQLGTDKIQHESGVTLVQFHFSNLDTNVVSSVLYNHM